LLHSFALGPRQHIVTAFARIAQMLGQWLRRLLDYWDTRSIVSQVISGVITAFVVATIVGLRRRRKRRR
jgi:hypothetical protein